MMVPNQQIKSQNFIDTQYDMNDKQIINIWYNELMYLIIQYGRSVIL